MTTTDQDRTMNELFARPDVLNVEAQHVGDDLVIVCTTSGRLWRIAPDGEYLTPSGLPLQGDLALVGGDWDFPAEHQRSETERVGGDTAVIEVEDIVTDDGFGAVVRFRFRREELQTMELVEFLGELGRTYHDLRLQLTGATPAWQS